MQNKRIGFFVALLLVAGLVLVGMPSDSSAAITGKIRGVITDNSGNPLPGANVRIEGTRRGATADPDGFYVIISVDPGVYELAASLIGYDKSIQQNVEVKSDYTSTVDFELRETTLEQAEVVVTARRPLVELDQTASRYSVTAEDIKRVPMVRDLNSIAALQPGVEVDGSNVIRGGNQSGWGVDVTYYVDGIRLVHSDGGSSNANGLFRAVNASAIQEVQVIVGGMEAEYGNAQAGIINVITRDGTQKFGGSGEYKLGVPSKKHWGYNFYDVDRKLLTIDATTLKVTSNMRLDDPEWAGELYIKPGVDRQFGTADDEKYLAHEIQNYTDQWGHRAEGMMNGPIVSNASFIVTASTIQEASAYPASDLTGYFSQEGANIGSPNYVGYIPSPFNIRSSGKLSFRPSDNISVKLGAVLYHNTNMQPTATTGSTRMYHRSGEGNGATPYFFRTDKTSRGRRKDKDDIFYVSLQHSLSPRTLYEARLSGFFTKVDTSLVPLHTSDFVYDKDGRYSVDRDNYIYDIAERNRLQFRFDLSSQVTKGHFLKAGIELTRYSTWSYNFNQFDTIGTGAYTTQDVNFGETVLGDPITNMSAFPADQSFKYNNGISASSWGGITGNGLPIGRGGDAFEPSQFAIYVQDKMEFQGMVLNAGIRFDALWVNATMSALPGAHSTPMFNQYQEYLAVRPGFNAIDDILNQDARYMPLTKASAMYQLSPRIGVSHPITDRSLVRFAFGQFFQIPTFGRVYSWNASVSSGSNDLNANGTIQDNEWGAGGNYTGPNWQFVGAEQTFNMEVGIDWNFVSDYTMSAATFYKSASDQQVRYPAGNSIYNPASGSSTGYGGSPPDGFEDARGIELSFRKSFSSYFSFNASYNASWRSNGSTSRSTRLVVPTPEYILDGNWWTDWTYDASGYGTPVTPDAATLQDWADDTATQIADLEANVNWAYDGDAVTGLRTYKEVTGADPNGPSGAATTESTYPGTANGDRRHNIGLTFTFGSPTSFGPGVRGFHLFGGLRSNIVYRFFSGIPYDYVSPISGKIEKRWSTIQTYTDLSVTKSFGPAEAVHADFFVEAENLFNQQNIQVMTSSAHPPDPGWEQYGWPVRTNPDSDFIRVFGEFDERGLYAAQPREISLGLRFFW